MLIVISRPGLAADAASFQSVARGLFARLFAAPGYIGLSVLRPGTFRQLEYMLRISHQDGRPFDLVHFDGHGDTDPSGRGCLLFEKGMDPESRTFAPGADRVSGETLGRLFKECGVRVVVLNACRSAYTSGSMTASLAEEMIAAGLDAVVAMRYAINVESASLFMSGLYDALTHGQPLSAAVNEARKLLHDQAPIETWGGHRLQDWPIPLLFESRAFRFSTDPPPHLDISKQREPLETISRNPRAVENGILILDRLLAYTDNILVNGITGSGKSSLLREFATWFHISGGTFRVIKSDSLQRFTPERLVEDARKALEPDLTAAGYRWEGIGDLGHRMAALRDVMFETPALWLWDSVDELVAAVRGEPSSYTPEEAARLRDFIVFFEGPVTQWLFSCCRGGVEWLGSGLTRITAPPLTPADSRTLLMRLTNSEAPLFEAAELWRPVVEWCDGNPLAIQVAAASLNQRQPITPEGIALWVNRATAGDIDAPDPSLFAPIQAAGRAVAARLKLSGHEGYADQLRLLCLYPSPFSPFCSRTRLFVKAGRPFLPNANATAWLLPTVPSGSSIHSSPAPSATCLPKPRRKPSGTIFATLLTRWPLGASPSMICMRTSVR